MEIEDDPWMKDLKQWLSKEDNENRMKKIPPGIGMTLQVCTFFSI